MSWLNELFSVDSVARAILLYSIIIVAGVTLGRIKFYGISLGITFVLFAGIAAGHFGLTANQEVIEFIKDFGLILFVFSIGLQVGPAFFSSFKQGGISLNLMALAIVTLGVITTITIHYITGVDMPVLVGIMSGAVTNTPGLGAAQQALAHTAGNNPVPQIGLGYAVAYPFGILGIILTMLLIRRLFTIDINAEQNKLILSQQPHEMMPEKISITVKNRSVIGKSIREVTGMIRYEFIVSRVMRNGKIMVASSDTILAENDVILVVTLRKYIDEVLSLTGTKSNTDISGISGPVVVRQVMVTNSKVSGKMIADLRIRTKYNVSITRVLRSGIEFVAIPGLRLQLGDKLTVVGDELSLDNVSEALGNSVKRLDEPNLVPIFIGIFLGVILGSIPIHIPGVIKPISLGLAGGPLVVAIIMSKYGHKAGIISYTTPGANLMLREIGIVLFLASIGMRSGEQFIPTLTSGEGFIWMGYGAMITAVPIIIAGIFARAVLKKNYLELCGLLAGSMTDPPALAYANSLAENEAPAIAYATVYPLVMFLRIFAAQMLILIYL